MKSRQRVQYTVRDVPAAVDGALRRKARDRGRSLNSVLLEALEKEAGMAAAPRRYDDLDHLVGSWVRDEAVEEALREQRKVDPGDWR